MNTAIRPYDTPEFRSNLIVMPKPAEPVMRLPGFAWPYVLVVLFWACVFYGIKELVR